MRELNRIKKTLSISILILFVLSLTAVAVSAAVSDAEKTEILNAHNQYRAEVGVSPLVWDDQLAASAQQWADQMNAANKFEHDPNNNLYGENLHQGDGTWTGKISTEMYSWGAEKKCFKNGYFPDIYNGQCDTISYCNKDWTCSGHYSQMIWGATQRIGCARSGNYWVCRYDPPGNMRGQKAY